MTVTTSLSILLTIKTLRQHPDLTVLVFRSKRSHPAPPFLPVIYQTSCFIRTEIVIFQILKQLLLCVKIQTTVVVSHGQRDPFF